MRDNEDDKVFNLCPRSKLKEMIEIAKNKYGISFKAGFEIEF